MSRCTMRAKICGLILILILLGFGFPVSAQEEDFDPGKHYVVNFSLYYPVSLNKTEFDRVNLNLSLAYGKVGSVQGLDLSCGASAVHGRLQGLQVCGLLSVVGESGQGIQISGLLSIAGENFFGLQASSLINIAGEDFKGIQATGLMNIIGQEGMAFQASGLGNVVGENLSGVQASGLFNVVGENLSGVQASGLFNVVGEDYKGIQASGLFNVVGEGCFGIQAAGLFSVTGDVLRGLQTGSFNIASRSEGLQIGVCNVAGSNRGVQIGVVNYTHEENTGLPLGLVNIAENGNIRGVLWGGNLVGGTAGIKFSVGHVYSILSLGALNLNDDIGRSLSYGFHYGGSVPLSHFFLRADVGYRFRDNRKLFRSDFRDPDQFIFEGRVLLEIPLFPHLSAIIGGGTCYFFDTDKSIESGQWKPLVVGGIEIF
jgi:hypothetical protein